MLKNYLSKNTKILQRFTTLLVVVVIVAIGTYLLSGSHAAEPYSSASSVSGKITTGASETSCSDSASGNCVLFSSSSGGGGGTGTGLYNGKLLGLNSSLDDLSALNNANAYKQLGVNTIRGDIELTISGSSASFNDVGYSGTSAQWVDTLTGQHIVPLPLLNQYIEMDQINIPNFVSATVNWCKLYCAGGSFYTGNSSANGEYAPQVLEILNEPYYGASYGYPVQVPTDTNAYASLMQAIRAGLNSAGLSSIRHPRRRK